MKPELAAVMLTRRRANGTIKRASSNLCMCALHAP